MTNPVDLVKLRADVDELCDLPHRVEILEQDVSEIRLTLDSLATRSEIADVMTVGKSTRSWSIASVIVTIIAFGFVAIIAAGRM